MSELKSSLLQALELVEVLNSIPRPSEFFPDPRPRVFVSCSISTSNCASAISASQPVAAFSKATLPYLQIQIISFPPFPMFKFNFNVSFYFSFTFKKVLRANFFESWNICILYLSSVAVRPSSTYFASVWLMLITHTYTVSVHILYGPLTTHPVLNVLNTRVRIGSWSLQLNSTFVK